MRYALSLTLLCGMAAWGQQPKPQYTVEVIVNGKPQLTHVDADPTWPRGWELEYALQAATHATVWTPKEWAETQRRMCKDATPDMVAMFECPAPAAQPAQKPAKPKVEFKVVAPNAMPNVWDEGNFVWDSNNGHGHWEPAMPRNTVDCDNAHGDPSKCTVEADEPAATGTGTVRAEPLGGLCGTFDEAYPCNHPPAPSLSCAPECRFEVRKIVGKEHEGTFCQGRLAPDKHCQCWPGEEPRKDSTGNPYMTRCVRVTHKLYLNGKLLGTLEER